MSKVWWCCLSLILPIAVAHAEPHVVMVTPRGETAMERVFMSEIKRQVGQVRFSLIRSDPSQPSAMANLSKLVRQAKPDLIYTFGTPTTVAVAGPHDAPHIGDIPIVFAVVAYPLRANLVTNLSQPGRNLTGVSHLAPLSAQLDAIRSFRPFTRLGLVYNPNEVNARFMLEDLSVEAKSRGLTLVVEQVGMNAAGEPDPATLAPRIQKLKEAGAEWLYLGPDTFVGFTHRQATTEAAVRADLPTFTANESAIRDAHSLFGLFAPVENIARLVASKAVQILKGEKKAAAVPIETLKRFSVMVNMCVATKIPLFPPIAMMSYAEFRLPVKEGEDTETPGSAKGCTRLL